MGLQRVGHDLMTEQVKRVNSGWAGGGPHRLGAADEEASCRVDLGLVLWLGGGVIGGSFILSSGHRREEWVGFV